MPVRDGTGPIGEGAMTGRGLGPCASTGTQPVNQPAGSNAGSAAAGTPNTGAQPVQNQAPVVPVPARPRRFFRACGRGFRGGRGRGRGRNR